MVSSDEIVGLGAGMAVIGGSLFIMGKAMDIVHKGSSKAFGKWF